MKINLLDIPVYYINMNKDKDKKRYIESKLNALGFKNINRVAAIEDKQNGRRGLSKSQLIALTQIKPPFIILEDDCDPKYFVSEIEIPDDADALYLGNSQWGYIQGHTGFYLKYKQVEGFDSLYRIYNMLSSHAILYLSKDYVDMCIRTTRYCAEEYTMPMDIPFATIQRFFNVYSFDKPFFIQKEYNNSMSAAPQFTNKRLTAYKKYNSPEDRVGNLYKDQII